METYPTWIRLHPELVDDTLATSVRARIHDPPWMCSVVNGSSESYGMMPARRRLTSASRARRRRWLAFAAARQAPRERRSQSSRSRRRSRRWWNVRLSRKAAARICGPGSRAACTYCACCEPPRSAIGCHLWIQQSLFVLPDGAPLDDETREWLELVDGRVPDGESSRPLSEHARPGRQYATDRRH